MGTYRKQIQIVGDILDAAEELTIDQEGASITKLIQKANISHGRISKILTNLVSQGLLEQVDSKRACMAQKDPLPVYDLIEKNYETITGVGEIGLDRTYIDSEDEWKAQKDVFSKQLSLAEKFNKPV